MNETGFNFDANNCLIGVISDTHGLLRPEAAERLRGVNLILHAGDLDTPEVLAELGKIAQTIAVRGNHDNGAWTEKLKTVETIKLGSRLLGMVHDLKDLKIDLNANAFHVVIFGHSHQPLIEERDGRLLLNPGSAGKRRFKLPVTIAHLRIASGKVRAEIIDILESTDQPANASKFAGKFSNKGRN